MGQYSLIRSINANPLAASRTRLVAKQKHYSAPYWFVIFFISVTLYHKKHILMVGDTMTKVDNFKEFVKKNQVLVTYVKENKMTWQKFYELYDLYGEDNNIWNEYLKKEEPQPKVNNTKLSSLSNIMEMAKNIDPDKLQDGITSIQKAISLFGDMITKNNTSSTNTYTPRPIYKKFDD